MSASPKTSSGVFMSCSITGASKMPSTVKIAPSTRVIPTVVWTARSTPSSSRAPKRWEMMTPAPTDRPMKKPTSILMMELVEPTAARASLLT